MNDLIGTNIYYTKNDMKCISYITAYLFFQALNLFVKLLIGDFLIWSIISKGILAVLMIRAMSVFLKKKLVSFLVTELLIVLSFTYTYIIGEYGNVSIKNIFFNMAVVFIPLAFSVACISDYRILLERLYLVAWPIAVILLLVALKQSYSIYDYNMPLSYAMLLQSLIFIDRFFEKYKWYDIAMASALVLFIVIGGSRGPILCLALYFVFIIFLSKAISQKQKVLLILIIAIVGLITLLNLTVILMHFIDFLDSKGISSRSLYYLYNHNFSDSGRSFIYKSYLIKAISGPALGFGIAGGWDNTIYPHNIFVELLVSYGILLGFIGIILTMWILFRGFRIQNESKHRLALVFIAYSASLLISNSFTLEPMFYITIPICLSEWNLIFNRRLL